MYYFTALHFVPLLNVEQSYRLSAGQWRMSAILHLSDKKAEVRQHSEVLFSISCRQKNSPRSMHCLAVLQERCTGRKHFM